MVKLDYYYAWIKPECATITWQPSVLDKTNCDGSYTQTRYHIPCVVCDIREQKNGKITVSPFESDEYFEYCYIVDANLFEPIPRQAKVV